jgi:hypothetical protein
MPCRSRRVACLTLAAAVSASAIGAAQDSSRAPPPPACTAAEHRQFDFWLGEWEVTNPAGQVVGQSRITSILDGCVLREEWDAARGGAGTSYNIYDAKTGRWHQTWVDKQGTLLLIEGGLDSSGAMVLQNSERRADGATVANRITWTRLGPDEVRQRWDTSADGGASWQASFNGLYRRKR